MNLSATRRRKILRGFGRATFRSAWWQRRVLTTRHCERCGGPLQKRFVAVEHRRRLVCRRCGSITYQNPNIVAATLPVRGKKIFLLRRAIEPARGKWTFPAGFMELGETVEQAAVRETWEEIRSRVRLTGLRGVYSHKDAGVVTVVFHAKVTGRAPSAGEESLCVESFTAQDIPWEDLAFRSTFHALYDWATSPEDPK